VIFACGKSSRLKAQKAWGNERSQLMANSLFRIQIREMGRESPL